MSIALKNEKTRDLDPNVLQRRAADPTASVWVSASAGTGKTKVLTDRVLRLLLTGIAPHKILGLTFTKAAASEMAIRINETLSDWAVMENAALIEKLQTLLGRAAEDHETQTARRLLADVIDTPGRLKIMTIHSFCQSILARFPLEAKLMPGFRVCEDREAADLLIQAKKIITDNAANNKTTPLYAALCAISETINEDQFLALLTTMTRERQQMQNALTQHFSIDGFYTALCQMMDIPAGTSAQNMLHEFCTNADTSELQNIADILSRSSIKLDQENAIRIYDWIATNTNDRPQQFADYARCYVTLNDTPKKKLLGKAIDQAHPHIMGILQNQAEQILTLKSQMAAAQIATLTRDLFMMGDAILSRYAALKSNANILDYEDLIFKTLTLLQNNSAWVQFKLDEGLDHILIDEAQDTNPEQWQIIEQLCAEFFAAHSTDERNRTVFTVGDEKQSIYAFQRASPEEFSRMQGYFADKITAAQKQWNKVDLNISFRSTRSVLSAVDAVFGHIFPGIEHHAFRRGQAGLVELWPIFESDDTPQSPAWDPPITIQDQQSGAAKLANAIAVTIKSWLEDEETLPSHNRPIQPGDIMVLVRTRNVFVQQLTRALKHHDVPVGGLDRLVLNNEIAVQDLLAAAAFALLPDDDLTLACLLKSPLIGMDEDTLFHLAHNRPGGLYEALLRSEHVTTITYLQTLQRQAKHLTPYEFFAHILQSPCPTDERSGMRAMKARLGLDAIDALDELLNATLSYERDHIANLQDFLLWQRAGSGDIKRESGETTNHVRILTVHGAKGLQAPIVFLPDTTGMPGQSATKPGERLLWPLQSNLDLPLWAPRKDCETPLYQTGKETIQTRLEEEYQRLLYVAMTRAEDRLYIAGHQGKRDAHDACWYHTIRRGLQDATGIEHDGDVLRLEHPQTKDPDRKPKPQDTQEKTPALPDWMLRNAPQEPYPPAPLVPSRPTETEPTTMSPLQADNQNRFRRGNLTHMLLQILPDLDKREQAAQNYLDRNAQDLSPAIRTSILQETLAILNHPEFTTIFGTGSRAETPVSGLLNDGRLISGQIDRLLVTESQILIIDYKTNRPPPTDPADIPKIYQKQMQAYADILREIYPDRAVKCALLWTDGPNLMPLDVNPR